MFWTSNGNFAEQDVAPDTARSLKEQHKDLCVRLRDDIKRAHRQYDRQFYSILDHSVDYFHNRLVEILGDDNVEALGEDPYPLPVLGR